MTHHFSLAGLISYFGTVLRSPYNFNSSNANANAWNVNSTGNLNANWVTTSNGVRPDSYYN